MVLGTVVEAVRRAAQEVQEGPTVQAKAQRAWGLTRIICRELLGLLSGIPDAYYAASLWRNPEKEQQRWRFNLLKNVRYGPQERNLLDVYTPKDCKSESSLPVLMFVHGGVWAVGDKLLFSPLGAILAHHGIIALLVQYTLYPQVLAKEQVKEVSRALTWALDTVSQYGGDPDRVHVMGHSSGAHLCAMLHWERAKRNLSFKKGFSSEVLEDKKGPRAYLGLSGVYNINTHYEYEQGRGVATLSCMKPAMNGPKGFSAMSPELLFGSLLALKSNQQPRPTEDDENDMDLSTVDTETMDWDNWASEQSPFVILASDNDLVVPPRTSIAFHKVLQELGCKSGVSIHQSLGHDDFGFWVKGMRGKEKANAQVVINEVVGIVNEEEKLDSFLHPEVDVLN
ncbi:unnamed protein product [Calypogeia fissa]